MSEIVESDILQTSKIEISDLTLHEASFHFSLPADFIVVVCCYCCAKTL